MLVATWRENTGSSQSMAATPVYLTPFHSPSLNTNGNPSIRIPIVGIIGKNLVKELPSIFP